jgi:hypothetical protein
MVHSIVRLETSASKRKLIFFGKEGQLLLVKKHHKKIDINKEIEKLLLNKRKKAAHK